MRRLVLLVGAIVLVDTTFYAAITPLLPDLAERLDLGKQGAGVLMGAYAAGTLLGALPGGWLAARVGVKPTVVLGLTLMSLSGVAFAFGEHIVVLDAARFLQGVGGACSWAAGMAWLAGAVPRERRGEVLGTALGAAIFGVQLGPVMGALATAIGRELAFSSTVLFGAALASWAWAMPAPRRRWDAAAAPSTALRERRMVAGMWLTALPAAAFGVLDVLAPLWLDVLGASALAIGAIFFAASGLEAVVSPLVGRFTDRHGAAAVIRAGLAGSAVAIVLVQLPGSAPVLGVAMVVVVGVLGTLWVPAMGLLTGGAERIGLDHGFAFAFFNLSWALGFTLGSLSGGGLAEVTADVVPYGAVAVLYVVSAAVAATRLPGRVGAGRYGIAP